MSWLERIQGHDGKAWRAALLSVAVLSILAQWPIRFDVTEDQRHSLSQATEDMLEELAAGEEEVLVRCYLEGDFPARYRRLADEIQSKLRTFARKSGGQIRWQFIDVAESGDEKTIGDTELALYEQGLRFTRIAHREAGVTAFQNIWPCAMVTVRGVDYPVQFLRSENMDPDEVMVQNAINQVEFNLGQAIRQGMRSRRPVVGILQGHGCWLPVETADFTNTLSETTDVVDVRLDGSVDALCEQVEGRPQRQPKYDALIVAGPDSTFSDRDKLLLDQYLMNEGRMLWLIDPLETDRDSLSNNTQTLATTREIGLFDWFFHHGIRLNRNMVLDAQCAPIMMNAGPMGDHRNMQMFSWYFAPVALSTPNAHPICANLDPIHFDFVSSLDLVNANDDRTSEVLVRSSPRSVVYNAPVRVAGAVVNLPPEHFEQNQTEGFPLAVLLEGHFDSFYALRLNPELRDDPDFAFQESTDDGSMIVLADADFIRNNTRPVEGGIAPLPLGFDRLSQRVIYDNKEWLLNAVSYLLDDDAQISLRSRSIAYRPLDEKRILGSETQWSLAALGAPIALVLLLGLTMPALRRRRWTRKA
ncbi:MAG: gliding motility-associated ABC transporter substrate-binding protein GldG [Crocinitomicaceae bacterium TMED114]|nr:MAG: gliding motility-associated ABC transporter substrate-binding protein GldG [Crocinitomicaceae bacterium TMED114]